MNRGRVGVVLFLVVVVGVLVVALQFETSSRPFDLDSADENGYLAVRLLLEEGGVQVDRIDAVDVDADKVAAHPLVYVPVASGASAVQVDQWREFVEAGGTLVLGTPVDGLGRPPVDPSSIAEETDEPGFSFGFFSALDGSLGVCDLDAFAAAEQLAVPFTALDFAVDDVASCFGDGERALIVTEPLGGGAVTNIASPDLFTNVVLGAPTSTDPSPEPPLDNGFVAMALFGGGVSAEPSDPDPVVAVVTSGVRQVGLSGAREWTEFLGAAKWAGLFQLAVAFLWYSWFRARRLGRVVTEPLPVSIEGSDYVGAVGNLLRRQGNASLAASTLRRRSARRFERDVGLPPGTPPEMLVHALAARTGRDPREIALVVVDGPVADDDALDVLSSQLEQLHQETLRV